MDGVFYKRWSVPASYNGSSALSFVCVCIAVLPSLVLGYGTHNKSGMITGKARYSW